MELLRINIEELSKVFKIIFDLEFLINVLFDCTILEKSSIGKCRRAIPAR